MWRSCPPYWRRREAVRNERGTADLLGADPGPAGPAAGLPEANFPAGTVCPLGAGIGAAAGAGEPSGGGFQRAVRLRARPGPDGGTAGGGAGLCAAGIYAGDRALLCKTQCDPANGGPLFRGDPGGGPACRIDEICLYPGGGFGPGLGRGHGVHGAVAGGIQPPVLAHAAEKEDPYGAAGMPVSGVSGGGGAGIAVPLRAVPACRVPDARRYGERGGPASCAGP